jgi:hypothetical protein
VIAIQKLGRHVFAVLVCVLFFALVPLVLYGSWAFSRAVSAADLGGPLNFVIIPLAGALLGLAVSVVVFLPLSLLAERFSFRRWWQVVASLTGALIPGVILGAIFVGPADAPVTGWFVVLLSASVGLFIVGGFFVYLSCIGICRRLFP